MPTPRPGPVEPERRVGTAGTHQAHGRVGPPLPPHSAGLSGPQGNAGGFSTDQPQYLKSRKHSSATRTCLCANTLTFKFGL